MRKEALVVLACALAALAAIVGLYWKGRLDAEARAKERVENAETQAEVAGAATEVLDRYTTQVHIIRDKSDAAIREVRLAPGAETPVPPALLDAWRRGLRDSAKAPADSAAAEPGS